MSNKIQSLPGAERFEEFDKLAQSAQLLSIKVPPFYAKKVCEEVKALNGAEGPLYRCVLPTEERMQVHAHGEVNDFVDDRNNMPADTPDTIVQKYRNRLLFFPTDNCAGHCQYCFRTDVLADQHGRALPEFTEKLDRLMDYLAAHPEVEEVILSGGDPMTLPPKRLKEILKRLKEEAKVAHIRVHTRTMVFAPRVFDEERCEALAEANARVVHHIVHPYEICDEVRAKINALNRYGIRSYNQFPVLRKVNDHIVLLQRLLTELDNLGIRNLSMFIPDPIKYSASFRMTLKRLFALMDQLNWTTSAWVNSTRLVLDTPHGKVRREDLKEIDEEKQIARFEREGHIIEYPDLPPEMDIPGNLNTLLWKS